MTHVVVVVYYSGLLQRCVVRVSQHCVVRVSQQTNTFILGKLHPSGSKQCSGVGEIIKKATKRFAV